MVLGHSVKTHDPITGLVATVERAVTPDTRSPDDADTLFSDSFVQRHTEFESLEEFCRASPCDRDSVGGVQHLSAEERDEFVAATTAFDTWSEMKQSAAVTDLVALTNA